MGAQTKQDSVQKAGPAAKAVVARGRTVIDLDGVSRAAGEEITLPPADIERLRARGFLVDPERPPIPLADGPTFGSATGPRIKRG